MLQFILISITALLPVLPLAAQSFRHATFKVDKQSELRILGESNVNSFTCIIRQYFDETNFRFNARMEEGRIHFQQTKLMLHARLCDCGHRIMNKDMRQALQVDQHPFISIELESFHTNEAMDNGPLTGTARTRITLAGTSRRISLPVRIRPTESGQWLFQASAPMRMSDFNVEPPVAMLGMVKAKDEIIIEIDLLVSFML
jgi:hypothetical protein